MTDETPEVSKPEPSKPPITYKVHQYLDVDQLKKDLAYTPTNLTDAMMQQASLFVHYGIGASSASRQVDDVKMILEITEAKIYRKLREEAAKKETKLTEAQLEKNVALDANVRSIRRALNEAKQIEANCKIAVESFRQRRDMLVQQGLLSREEMKGEVSISRRNAAEDAGEATKKRVLARIEGGQDVAE